jgi:LacI family transcriptional regulator
MSNPVQRQKRATIRDVARLSGVSISTVSLALNAPDSASAATRAKVLEAVERLDYEPNASARSLKRGRTHSIGLIVPDLANPYFVNIVAGVEGEARARGYVLVVGSTDWQTSNEERYSSLLRTQRLDGVIYNSGSGLAPSSLLELATDEPVVFVDERVVGFEGFFVGVDNRGGARDAASYLFGLGHRRIAIIGGPTGLWTAEQRLSGYREAAVAAGVDLDAVPVVHGNYQFESGRHAAATILDGDPAGRPTALLIANDMMALGAIAYCREVGLDVPTDIGIVGFDDIPSAVLMTPPLTTVRQPGRELGVAAVRVLLDRADGLDPERSIMLPADLVVRGSACPPKGGDYRRAASNPRPRRPHSTGHFDEGI